MSTEFHHDTMRLALSEALRCDPSPSAFSVGCVLVSRWPDDTSTPVILSRGYSRELAGNTHAEANALTKANSLVPDQVYCLGFGISVGTQPSIDEILRATDVYTTMEPCSIRTSGLAPCADALIAARVRRCIIGVGEPDDFVQCEGAKRLSNAGIEVIWLKGMESECLKAARKGYQTNI